MALDEPEIGGHAIPGLDSDEIAVDQVTRIHPQRTPTACDSRGADRERSEGVQDAARPRLLREADYGVDDQDAHDHESIDGVSDDERGERCGHEHIDERAAELVDHNPP